MNFDIATQSQYPFFQYDENPPPGVTPQQGITVEALITSPSGKNLVQPCFYMTEIVKNGSGSSMYFAETNKKYWTLRFSPQEIGDYQVRIRAKDAQGETTSVITTFSATAPIKKGFVQVSKNDSRYFEFTNGELYWPIGPAWQNNQSANPNAESNDYSQYKGTGQNFERPWMGGYGAYSTNWARWKSSAEQLGNEGVMTRLNFQEHYPGHELSYELFYPDGYRFWLTTWLDDMFGPRLKANSKYQVKLVYKTANLAGPRNSAYPYGLTIKAGTPDVMWTNPTIDQFETAQRNSQKLIPNYIITNDNWQTVSATFTADSDWANIYVYLDNVTAGQAYIDEFSIKECLTTDCSSLGGEVIRNPLADEHTYVEQRPAAFFDWQVDQGEQNGVFFKYVVQDKNDWIQNHLKADGTWATTGDGYYQDENTKARWLLRQWYRYLIARWGYSTAIQSWELNNEGPPDEDPAGSRTAPHWRTAQAFAKFMHDNDSHPHLATTSFWCCWRPDFWGNTNETFLDIGYADVHEYRPDNAELSPEINYTYDIAAWINAMGNSVLSSQIGKPTLMGEIGINVNFSPISDLQEPNPGVWYHNMLWAGLSPGALFSPNYWFSEHLKYINREAISKPFYQFIQTLDVNKGGYTDISATSTNSKLRTFGQKNLTKGKAYLWIQNSDHTWYNVMNGVTSAQTGAIDFTLIANKQYDLTRWNTTTGITSAVQTSSDATGKITLAINDLTDDTAVTITPVGYIESTTTPTTVLPTTTPTPTLTATSSLTRTATPQITEGNGEWTQFGHDPQRTNYTPQTVATPWKYKWQWNGADSNGKKQPDHLTVPDLAQPITGGGRVYIPASNKIHVLNQVNGSIIWTKDSMGSLSSTFAYDAENLFVASSNNILYKLDAATGSEIGKFTSSGPLTLAPLIVGNYIYVINSNGILTKIDKSTMLKIWDYNANSPAATTVSYSKSKDVLIFVTQDLFVHAVSNATGLKAWRVKPTNRNYSIDDPTNDLTEALNGWPVIAEQHGLVFVRYRLEWNTLWTWSPFPATNSEIRANMSANPNQQALFALNLSDGQVAFIPNVGNGGAGDGGVLPMGPQPVIRHLNNQEVAYIIWRNGQTCASGWCDGREDATMGEMVLDNSTVPGYTAGDVRFVKFVDIQTDEMMNLTMSDDILFHSHWLINAAAEITDRNDSLGETFINPIETVDAPFVIWRQVYCPPNNLNCNPQIFPGGSETSWGASNCPFDATHRYCEAGLYSYGDQRGYPPGFYQYHNDYNSGSTPFTVVSNGLVIIKTNDGGLITLENGDPLAETKSSNTLALVSNQNIQILGSETLPIINYQEANKYIGQTVIVDGIIKSVINHLPKAIYLGFEESHEGRLLIRVFNQNLSKFNYDLNTLENKHVQIKGFITLYWPETKDTEIIVNNPSQITILR